MTARRERAAARRDQLVGVTLELFVERGIERVTVADVASRAGVAPGLIYHYFGSKDGLVAAVLESASPREAFAELGARLAGRPAAEGLREFAHGAAALLEERGDVVRVLFRELLAPASTLTGEISRLQDAVLGDLARSLEDRVAAGELRPHDPRAPLRLLISGILVLGVTGQPVGPWVDGFVDTVLHGIERD